MSSGARGASRISWRTAGMMRRGSTNPHSVAVVPCRCSTILDVHGMSLAKKGHPAITIVYSQRYALSSESSTASASVEHGNNTYFYILFRIIRYLELYLHLGLLIYYSSIHHVYKLSIWYIILAAEHQSTIFFVGEAAHA